MLTQGEDVEVHALKKRGWSYAAIGRHIDCDWRTVKAYLEGHHPGVRRRTEPDPLEPFVPYLTARFADDAHVWASALFDEVRGLGYALSYPSFARQVRTAGLRPHCEACSGVVGRDTIDIPHPPGEEILCGFPHKISYGAPGNMRRSSRWCCSGRSAIGGAPHIHSPSRNVISSSSG